MNTSGLLAKYAGLSVVVVGDVCLDSWCMYDPALSEPSRETGLNRVAIVSTETTAGAAGTVANNLAALGAGRVAVLGVVGDDGHGLELHRALERAGVDTGLLINSSTPTFTYTKLLNRMTGEEDLGRIDFLPPPGLEEPVEQMLLGRFREACREFDVIIVSDQAETETEGSITPLFREELQKQAAALPNKIFWADSRMRLEKFRGVVVKPNQREAREACTRLGEVSLQQLRSTIGHSLMFVTHGSAGVQVLDGSRDIWVRTRAIENPVDICGAGDSFTAAAALALGAGATPVEAARMGNLVASITIMKKGTGTASPIEILEAESRLA